MPHNDAHANSLPCTHKWVHSTKQLCLWVFGGFFGAPVRVPEEITLSVLADGDLNLNIILFACGFQLWFHFHRAVAGGGQVQAEQGGHVNGGLSARELRRRRRNGEMS